MRKLPALTMNGVASLSQPRQALAGDTSLALAGSRLAFYCLVGFVATQGHLVPLVSLPLNWAVWPSLPDLFGVGLVLAVALSSQRGKMEQFDGDMFKDLVWMGLVFALDFLLMTIPFSTTGEGIKYGGFSLILFAKYLVVYWAAAMVPLDRKRMQVLHFAALLALLWVVATMLADRFYLIEIDNFTRHLPVLAAGKWGVPNQNSTVSVNPGGTAVVILILGALAVATARHRFGWLVEGLVFVLGGATSFISGSRQGLVRMVAFVVTYSATKPAKYIVTVLVLLVPGVIAFSLSDSPSVKVEDNPAYLLALERQEVLLTDPFSNEGLAGRPELWVSVIDTLNEDPVRWIIGYGMGNYVEYGNASHNMVLRLLQDGGIIELILIGVLWIRIFRRIWVARQAAWALVALSAGLLTSTFTSDIFVPTLATGWYLGLYFVSWHVIAGNQPANAMP